MPPTTEKQINVERLFDLSPVTVDEAELERARLALFGRPKRLAPAHYTLGEPLGRGQSGRVFRAYDTRLGRDVAIKSVAFHGDRALHRLDREAHALANLRSPYIVQVFDKGIADAGQYYLATELVLGTRLDKWVQDASRTRTELLEVFAQAAEGLLHAHQQGMVHRDFKPANAIVDESGRLRILDFGLVQLRSDLGREDDDSLRERPTAPRRDPDDPPPPRPSHEYFSTLTHKGAILGTLAYAAPEQLAEQQVDPRSDQYSLCVAIFEAFRGFRPFHGRSLYEQAELIAAGRVRRGQSRHKMPRWLNRVVTRGLCADPNDRFEHVGLIAETIRKHLRPTRPWLAAAMGGGLTIAAGAALAVITRPPTIDLNWDGAWPAGVTAEALTAQHGEELTERLSEYEHTWKQAASEYAERPDRDPDSENVRCLRDGKQQFGNYISRLLEAQPGLSLDAMSPVLPTLWLSQLYDPRQCLGASPSVRPAEGLTQQLYAAQAARFQGDYARARDILLPIAHSDDVAAGGLLRGLVGYELGVSQYQLRDPDAWSTFDAASRDNAGDERFVLDVLTRQLDAGTREPGIATARQLAALTTEVAERGDTLGGEAWARTQFSLAASLTHQGHHEQARAHYRTAEKLYRELAASTDTPHPRHIFMADRCVLRIAYTRTRDGTRGQIDFAELDATLESVWDLAGQRLGATHPFALHQALKVYRIMGDEGRSAYAHTRLRARLAEWIERGGDANSLVATLARAERTRLDVDQHDKKGTTQQWQRWFSEAADIRQRLDDAHYAPGYAKDVLDGRRTVFHIYVNGGDYTNSIQILSQIMTLDTTTASQRRNACAYVLRLHQLDTDQQISIDAPSRKILDRLRPLCT